MLTIETWLRGLGRQEPMRCPFWPPDLYAIAGTLLKRSGAYLRVLEHGRDAYLDGVESIGRSWRQRIERLKQPITSARFLAARPREVEASWTYVVRFRDLALSHIRNKRTLTEQPLRLIAIADEASAGIGVDWGSKPSKSSRGGTFLSLAEELLSRNGLHSFCWEVPDDVICVLGKQHTPQRGATFRSLTHHLSLYWPNDIEARWIQPLPKASDPDLGRETLNLLLLPWPLTVETDDFSDVCTRRLPHVRDRSGYFRFHPKNPPTDKQFARQMRDAVAKARRHAGAIDAIVFPELALSHAQYRIAEKAALDERSILICGLRERSKRRGGQDLNLSVLQPAGAILGRHARSAFRSSLVRNLRLVQAKHHRWCLDRNQIVNYQLGGRLHASRQCWENIELPPRVLHFVTLNRLTWSVLICEDLARQDPAADLIRAVGPNLLIALLMDGPQLSGRSSRYASVLAEDPGTSVLTLTSLGMAERSRPVLPASGRRTERSRVVALWRDSVSGEVEISLDPGDDACVLSLECRITEEFCADGRGDGTQTRCPVFAGYRSFRSAA